MHLTPSWDKFVREALHRGRGGVTLSLSSFLASPRSLLRSPKKELGTSLIKVDHTDPWLVYRWFIPSLSRIAYNCRGIKSVHRPEGYAMLMSRNADETVVHGYHCPGDMAVRMREVLVRPWVSLRMPLVLNLPSYNVSINLRTHVNFWLSLCRCQKVEKVIGNKATARDTLAFACYASIGSKLPSWEAG